ncbi:MAG: succinate dehydrogenase/fumarate reductase iron-sulfur subunit [bacterium]
MKTERTIRVRRGTPGNPSYDTFTVPTRRRTTVLDALEYIHARLDETLLYRHSCHHGSCGTCGMLVNGEQRLACLTGIEETAARGGRAEAGDAAEAEGVDVVLEPLDAFAHLRDLAVDPTGFFNRYPEGATYLRGSDANKDAPVAEEVLAEGHEGWERFENCIECGLCVSACPVTQAFVGPATLAAFHRELKNRPERREEILGLVDQRDGVWACRRALNCSRVCPTKVYPAKHIAMLQREIEQSRE